MGATPPRVVWIRQLLYQLRAEYQRLVNVVALITDSVPLAEDAVQEAFARACERSRRGQHFEHLAGWVVTVALNYARSGRRRAASERIARERVAALATAASDRDTVMELDIALVVRAALDGLAKRQLFSDAADGPCAQS